MKKILLDKLLQRDNFEEILKMFHHETLFLLQMRHPNVVELVGMCSQSMPPLLLFELLDGVHFIFFSFHFFFYFYFQLSVVIILRFLSIV